MQMDVYKCDEVETARSRRLGCGYLRSAKLNEESDGLQDRRTDEPSPIAHPPHRSFFHSFAIKMTSRTVHVAADRRKRRRQACCTGMRFTVALAVASSAHAPTIRAFSLPAKPASVGQQIQQSTDVNDLLAAASALWVPTDDDLPPHYCQEVHHEKRQRWAGQLLGKMGQIIPASCDAALWTDERLCRAIEAAATPFGGRDVDRAKVEGRAISEALVGLASTVGRTSPAFPFDFDEGKGTIAGVSRLISRAESIANDFELKDAVEVRWAARTLMARLPGLSTNEAFRSSDQDRSPIPELDARVSHLPFDIFPLGVDWPSVCNGEYADQSQLVSTLRDAIPFNFDTIVTRTGSEVIERRGTAWVADEGIGALAYSGKLMKPQVLPDIVSSAMRATERVVLDHEYGEETSFFDCALCNHYPDAEAACKFHTDPEHGSMWDRLTCVISAGDDRRFAFRPISDISSWGDWDTIDTVAENNNDNAPAVFHMFAGDIVKMNGRCNDDFWHAVYADDVATRSNGEGRISLVFKRAIDRNGKRGHGLSGEGRRSKRRRNQSATTNTSSANRLGVRNGGKRRSKRRPQK